MKATCICISRLPTSAQPQPDAIQSPTSRIATMATSGVYVMIVSSTRMQAMGADARGIVETPTRNSVAQIDLYLHRRHDDGNQRRRQSRIQKWSGRYRHSHRAIGRHVL